MNAFSAVVRFVLTPHNPYNVVLWLLHRLINARLVLLLYRRFVLPVVVRRVGGEKKIRVVFLPMNVAMWRYDRVYRQMCANPRFDPIIVTAPRIIQDTALLVRDQKEMLNFFKGRKYCVEAGYDVMRNKWIDLCRWSPDIIFYAQPYEGMLPCSYEHWRNLKSLVCYTPYAFQFSQVKWNWDNALQNYAWLHLVSLPHHLETCRSYSRIRAENAVPVGYFFEEEFAEVCKDATRVNRRWRDNSRKRVVWAPHHSLQKGASFATSSFLEICDDMLALRDKYKDRVVFAFKPHPMLRDNLYQRWGKEKTEAYYANWATSADSFLDEGDFIPLFAGSDAMIHCSGSFIVDYIYTGKPVQYVYCKDRNAPDFGEIGEEALKVHYPAHSAADIERFLEEVVLSGNDPMRDQREAVYQKHLKSPNGKSFSENVVDTILRGLGKE